MQDVFGSFFPLAALPLVTSPALWGTILYGCSTSLIELDG